MPPDLALISTLISSNYPFLELIFMVPKVFEPLTFYCTLGKAIILQVNLLIECMSRSIGPHCIDEARSSFRHDWSSPMVVLEAIYHPITYHI